MKLTTDPQMFDTKMSPHLESVRASTSAGHKEDGGSPTVRQTGKARSVCFLRMR